jgi:hypothetical protein
VERTVEKRTSFFVTSSVSSPRALPFPAQADRRPRSIGVPCPTRGSGQDPEPGPFDGMLVDDMGSDVLSPGVDAARPKLGTGPVEKDTEWREDEGFEGR